MLCAAADKKVNQIGIGYLFGESTVDQKATPVLVDKRGTIQDIKDAIVCSHAALRDGTIRLDVASVVLSFGQRRHAASGPAETLEELRDMCRPMRELGIGEGSIVHAAAGLGCGRNERKYNLTQFRPLDLDMPFVPILLDRPLVLPRQPIGTLKLAIAAALAAAHTDATSSGGLPPAASHLRLRNPTKFGPVRAGDVFLDECEKYELDLVVEVRATAAERCCRSSDELHRTRCRCCHSPSPRLWRDNTASSPRSVTGSTLRCNRADQPNVSKTRGRLPVSAVPSRRLRKLEYGKCKSHARLSTVLPCIELHIPVAWAALDAGHFHFR